MKWTVEEENEIELDRVRYLKLKKKWMNFSKHFYIYIPSLFDQILLTLN